MANNFTNQNIEPIIAKMLAGEASEAEIRMVEEWKLLDEKNAEFLAQFEKLWDNSTDANSFTPGVDSAWSQVQAKMQATPVQKLQFRYSYILSAAASIAIILLVWWFWPGRRNEHGTSSGIASKTQANGIHLHAVKSALTANLPDQTLVILQPGSTLDADSLFGKTHRQLTLKGNAYFKTVHGMNFIFTVKTSNMVIKDIGTAFYINTEKNQNRVWVTQGSVRVITHSDSALLATGDSATVVPEQKKIDVHLKNEKQNDKTSAPQDKTIVFERTELSKVVQMLNLTYQSHIKLGNPKLSTCKLTASFKNERLETVLDILRETFNLEIRKEDDVIILEGKGCQ